MVTFREYFQGDKAGSALATSITGQSGNKSLMRGDRKHQNLVKKEYSHKSPYVSNLINGGAQQIKLMGAPLLDTLKLYDVDFVQDKCKGLGNSGVEVSMFIDADGNQCGMLKRK